MLRKEKLSLLFNRDMKEEDMKVEFHSTSDPSIVITHGLRDIFKR